MFICPRNMLCIVQVPVYALSMFWYLYCSYYGTCIASHLILQVIWYQKVLQSTDTYTVIWYPHSISSSTSSSGANTVIRSSHQVPEGPTVNRYLHSHPVPILHVIWYPYSMSFGTHTPCHQVLNSSGTNTMLIWYSKSSSTRRFYSQSVPAQSSGTHTPCHVVPILHVIRYRHSMSFGNHAPYHMVLTIQHIQY
jgi:hypothetical protein